MSLMAIAAEFQAVVFAAGKGSRYPEILEGRPKCLLPIGSFPLIWYPLKMLQKHGYQDVMVIVLEHEKLEIQQRLEKTGLKIKIDYHTLSGDSDVGTAEALRQISDRIKTDLVLVSCDTIIDVSLFEILKLFREQNATVVSLLLRNSEQVCRVPGPKIKNKSEIDMFGMSSQSNRLVFMGSASDFENDFIVPGHLLRQNEVIEIHSGLLDAHVYIIKRWMLDFLETNSGLSTLKGEMLPFIVKKQMSVPFNWPNQIDKLTSEVNIDLKSKDINEFIPFSETDKKICNANIFNRRFPPQNELIKCYAVKAPLNSFGIRVNTLSAFCSANQQIWEKFVAVTEINNKALVSKTSDIKSSQIKQTTIGDQVIIQSGCSVVNSTLGSNCSVHTKSSISGCVLMDKVTIGENVLIENCIVCEKSVISSGCVLRNCLIGYSFVVPENTKAERVHLSNSEGFMEI